MAAVFFDGGEVTGCGGVRPHFAVHGGGEEDGGGSGEGEVDGGEGIGGEAPGKVAEGVGAEGGDEEEVGVVGEFDVAGLPGVLFVFEADEDGLAGEDLEGEGGDELGGGPGEDAMDFMAELGELTGEVCGFVGRNGPCDA